jgi:malonate-semialdehyde dehydrogenase (acetylating)/methylmalonate-semialdehyde dehydrogenase
MPDASKEDTLNAIVSAAFGSSGQRCMALTTILLVGESQQWIPDIVAKAKSLKIGTGTDAKTDVSPMCYKELFEKVNSLIGTAEKEGAKVLMDGRNLKVDGYPNGLWVGPTIFDNVKTNMTIYTEEIFGPCMCIMRVDSLEEAVQIINK